MYLFKSEVIQGRKGVIFVVEWEEISLFMFSYEIELYLVVEMELYVSLPISLTTVFFFFFIKSCLKSKIRDTTISEQKKRLLPSH